MMKVGRPRRKQSEIDAFAKNLKTRLTVLKLKPADLARRLGVSKSVLSLYLRGSCMPNSTRHLEIEKLLEGYESRMGHAEGNVKPFGERLKALLEEKEWGAVDFAKRVGVSNPTLYSYLRNNEVQPLPPQAVRIAEALDTDLESLGYLMPETRSEETQEQRKKHIAQFANRLQNEMKRKNITAEQLAELVGIHALSVKSYLNERALPASSTAQRLADALDTDLKSLGYS